jgi:hypothetical protein
MDRADQDVAMTMHRMSLTALSMVLAVTACDVGEAESETTSTFRSTPPDEELEDLLCPGNRQVALRPLNVAECPAVAGWLGGPLFASASPVLKRFCQYDWNGAPGSQPNLAALNDATNWVRIASDCGVAFTQTSDAVWAAVGSDVEAAFHHGIGLASATDLDLPATESSRWKVAVAVVDSVPEPKPVAPRSQHGEMMVSLINDIACPAGIVGCEVKVLRSLGLPRYDNGLRDDVNGGYYGTQKDIAKAIYDSVQTWRATLGAPSQPEPAKLIINLSVGWEGGPFGDMEDTTPRPAVEAVHTAIEFAVCWGALVIASAGNQGYMCETGPLLPGAWESEPAPDAARCQELGAPPPPASVGYQPLVYSIGGLTHDRQPMTGTREGGMPRLAALATNAVAGGDSTSITGTSVGSAGAAGIAALVWSYNPQLTPSGVMSMLYLSGAATSLTADYYLPGTVWTNVHAINACAALEAACNLPSSNCPFSSPLACIGAAPPVAMVDVFDELATSYDEYESPPVIGDDIECASECGTPSFAFIADPTLPTECPEPSSQKKPFTLPQPTQIGCPNCTLDVVADAVYASIDTAYAGVPITDVTVSVFDGASTTYFRFGSLPLFVDRITRLQLDPTRMPAAVSSASISLTFNGGRPVVDPLLLGP